MTAGLIQADIMTIKALFSEFYDVPKYQREYVWLPEHIEQLLDDVYTAMSDDRDNYFLGTLVVSRVEKNKYYDLIDGQQRLTTLLMIFCAFKHYLQRHQIKPYQAIEETLKGNISTTQLDIRLRIYPQHTESREFLEFLASDRGVEVDKILLNNLFDADTRDVFACLLRGYDAITKWLADKFTSDISQMRDEKLNEFRQFYAYFLEKVQLIRIRTINISEAMRLFETINDRGVRLDAVSLLKNMMFMNVPEEQYMKLQDDWTKMVRTIQHRDIKESTIRFIRYVVMADYLEDGEELIREDKIYSWFSENRHRTLHDKKPQQFVNMLNERAMQFTALRKGKNTKGNDCDSVNNIKQLSSSVRQHIPCMMAAHRLNDAQQQILAQTLENTLFTLIFTSFSPSTFEKKLTLLTHKIREAKTNGDINEVKEYLSKYFINLRKSEFLNRLRTFSVVRMRPNVIRYVLAKLTRSVMRDEDTPLENYIDKLDFCPIIPLDLPINLTEQQMREYMSIAQSVGNFVLIERKLAKDVRNNVITFQQAITRSDVPYIRRLAQQMPKHGKMHAVPRKWDMHAVQDRRDHLLAVAEELWFQ